MAWIASLFVFTAAVSGANVNLEGEIRSENNQGIPGARVSLKKHPAIAALTDANGAFALSGTATAAAGGVIDTLVVIAKGYRTSLLGISTYETSGISVSLAGSNPWIPSGPLEYAGGMVKITARGHDFEMGQPCDTVRGLLWDMPTTNVEQPVHTVHFTYDFWMDTVEVTQGEYDSLMKLTYPENYSRPTWNASNGLGAHRAAYSVEWGSAALFCNARSKCEGLPDTAYLYTGITGRVGGLCTLQNVSTKLHANAYRLPTEAEWEYAYRAGTATDYYWGKNFSDYPAGTVAAAVDSYAIWNNNSFGVGRDNVIHLGPGLDSVYYGTHEVGKRKPNAYGLYDMAGNLSEWCNDWYDYYPWGAITDPVGSSPANPASFSRVQRGGNWSNDISWLRATERQFDAADYKFLFCGFRTATSGRTSDIKRKTGRRYGGTPSSRLIAGTLFCDNVAGCEIALYTLQGKRVFSTPSRSRIFSFTTRALPRGSYIVRITSMAAGKIIHVTGAGG
ncbi:MAG: SUMF1/EgtB/PvdO family nonheme iron enzyme [Chitinispirillaceae bacterium]|nr:SUMF1/EgtB/PvdO family nonheme iron enzyme [Chitinispirillaceae bacterium]